MLKMTSHLMISRRILRATTQRKTFQRRTLMTKMTSHLEISMKNPKARTRAPAGSPPATPGRRGGRRRPRAETQRRTRILVTKMTSHLKRRSSGQALVKRPM
jgi:hypothetical protein